MSEGRNDEMSDVADNIIEIRYLSDKKRTSFLLE